uniref:Uncharacterized protein n=1 Tax=viral metagenome TaxID=1070528 RepID=A0A6M3Y018_9ZZZZ
MHTQGRVESHTALFRALVEGVGNDCAEIMGQAYSYEVGKRRVRAYLKRVIRDYQTTAEHFYNHGLEDGAQKTTPQAHHAPVPGAE